MSEIRKVTLAYFTANAVYVRVKPQIYRKNDKTSHNATDKIGQFGRNGENTYARFSDTTPLLQC